ncbi:hypothetical protein REPUB_Repub01dG0176400 [Reevesia pubescens]
MTASFTTNYLMEFQRAQQTPSSFISTRRSRWEKPCGEWIKLNFDGLSDSTVLEATAALDAIRFATEMGFQNIILEGDCLWVIDLLKRDGRDFSSIGNLISECKLLLSGLSNHQTC